MEQDILGQLVSPEVHADHTVTFRIKAPEAKRVQLVGLADLSAQDLSANDEGVWEVTVGPLEPELHSYVFEIDGARVTDPQNRQVKKWLSCESMVEVPGDPPLLHELQSVPHGTVHHHTYRSATTNTDRGVYVYTPPGYSSDRSREYPLLLLLHGYGDGESAWVEVGRAPMIADNLLSVGKIRPMIIAMPYGHPLPIAGVQSFDDYASKNTVAMESDLQDDLLPLLRKEYRLCEGRDHRAIVGLSMGGGQSLSIGLKNLDDFAWVGGFSSAAPQGSLDQQFNHLVEDVKQTNQQLRLFWIGCGRDDFLLERNETFVSWLTEHQIQHQWRLTDGGHEWLVWRKYLAEFLPLIFQ